MLLLLLHGPYLLGWANILLTAKKVFPEVVDASRQEVGRREAGKEERGEEQ